MPDFSNDDLQTAAANPKSVTVADTSATQHSLTELMALEEKNSADAAISSAKRGMVFQRMKPPGTT